MYWYTIKQRIRPSARTAQSKLEKLEVCAWWTADSGRTPAAPYTIHHADGSATVRVNQTQNSGQWVRLGAYRFAADQTARVVLNAHEAAEGWVVADAVRFILQNQ